ncbi:MAG: hypothetical protein IKO36_03730 [Bacteroidaceae bacterium]|nr:hypothetical protein [Bacteroidaceae bacterium]
MTAPPQVVVLRSDLLLRQIIVENFSRDLVVREQLGIEALAELNVPVHALVVIFYEVLNALFHGVAV